MQLQGGTQSGVKVLLHDAIVFRNLQCNAVATQVADEIACVTPYLATCLAMKIALWFTGKINFQLFAGVRDTSQCATYSAISLVLLSATLHCKLHEKLPCVTAP